MWRKAANSEMRNKDKNTGLSVSDQQGAMDSYRTLRKMNTFTHEQRLNIVGLVSSVKFGLGQNSQGKKNVLYMCVCWLQRIFRIKRINVHLRMNFKYMT